ncbi:MFS general substrate transporter [Mycena kentingensis (nom. inval.)]|nr:MFS general substrate transporter [Mycena kentingensis (nom. inval.)]
MPPSSAPSPPQGSVVEKDAEAAVYGEQPSLPVSSPPQTKAQRRTELVQVSTIAWILFLVGWNDGSTGPLLLRIQESYGVGYTILSLIFVFGCVGSFVGSVSNIVFDSKYGFGKLILLGSFLQIIGFALQAPHLPFPVFVLARTITGFGSAMQDSQGNGYVASLASNHAGTPMAIIHAAYGAGAVAPPPKNSLLLTPPGALVSPLVATQFARDEFIAHNRWAYHFITTAGLTTLNTAVLAWVFKGKRQEECLAWVGQVSPPKAEAEPGTKQRSNFRQIMAKPAVHALAAFLLVYAGIEVTVGGWIVSFMVTVRGAGPSAGYIASGFFGGLTLGRIVLLPINRLVSASLPAGTNSPSPQLGEYRAVFLYTILALGLQLITWLVPSIPAGATAVSLVGLFLGPLYPIAVNHAGRLFPSSDGDGLLTGIIGWMAGVSTVGAAGAPFITGAIAGAGGKGVGVVQPVIVAMLGAMLGVWALVPRR